MGPCFVISLGPSPAQATVVPPLCSPSPRDLDLASSLVCCLDFGFPFKHPGFYLDYPSPLLPRRPGFQPPRGLVIASLVTWCMSNRQIQVSSQDIADLVAALQGLTVVVTRIANSANQPTTTVRRFEEDWEIVEEEYAPGAPSSPFAEVYPVTGGTNYTQVPQFCYDLAKHRLTGASIGSVARTDRAFFCGTEAKEALRLGTPYYQEEGIGLQAAHWIILRSSEIKGPCRVTSRRELNRLLGSGRPGPSAVWECFPSITELQIFCVGAGIPIPPLVRWRSRT